MTTDDRIGIGNRSIETIRGHVYYVGFALCSLTKREREGENEDEKPSYRRGVLVLLKGESKS